MSEPEAILSDALPMGRKGELRGRWLLVLMALVGYAGIHLWLAGALMGQVNHTDEDILGADQKHNLAMALETRGDLNPDLSKGISGPLKRFLPHRTDGVLNPLWPWLAAWLADADHEVSEPLEVTAKDRALFNRGRWFNVGLSLGFVLVLGVTCARVFSVVAAVNVVLLVGLGAMLPRAIYFQPETVYYVFFTLTWVACVFALLRNSLWIYSLIGVVSGIAYLAKGSVHPLLGVFVGVSTLRWLWGWLLAHWPGRAGTTMWVRRDHFFGLGLLVFVHLMTISPRLATAKEQFGDPFHSFPGYWMWFDSFPDCFEWMNEHRWKEPLEAMTEAERPSLANYAKTHSGEQMLARLREGVGLKLMDLWTPGVTKQSKAGDKPWKGVLECRGLYLAALVGLLLVLVLGLSLTGMEERCPRQCLHPETISVVIFVVGAFGAYTLAYGWYSPIGRGERFMLSLYPSLVICVMWALESVMRRARRRSVGKAVRVGYAVAQWGLMLAVVGRLVEIWQWPMFRN